MEENPRIFSGFHNTGKICYILWLVQQSWFLCVECVERIVQDPFQRHTSLVLRAIIIDARSSSIAPQRLRYAVLPADNEFWYPAVLPQCSEYRWQIGLHILQSTPSRSVFCILQQDVPYVCFADALLAK